MHRWSDWKKWALSSIGPTAVTATPYTELYGVPLFEWRWALMQNGAVDAVAIDGKAFPVIEGRTNIPAVAR